MRTVLWLAAVALFGICLVRAAPRQITQPPIDGGLGKPHERRLPDGRSQAIAISKSEHRQALEEADQLVKLSEQLRDELQKAGNFVVPVSAVKRTEDIEKLARKLRGRLKD